MSWIIYCHTHIESGRRYIGLTSQTMLQRWNQHVSKSKSSNGGRWHFPNAIRKYGKEAFSHEILEICDSLESANIAEEKWITCLGSTDPRQGFNLIKGGSHKPHSIRKNPWDDPRYREHQIVRLRKERSTPEWFLKASATSKTMHARPEVKEKLSCIQKARMNIPEVKEKYASIHRGRKNTPEAIERMSLAQRGKKVSDLVRKKISSSMKLLASSPGMREHILSMNKSADPRIRDKISKSQLGKPRCLASLANLDEYRRQRRQQSFVRTQKNCQKHGVISKEDCYIFRRGTGIRLMCKLCVAARNYENKSRRPEVRTLGPR